MTYYKIMCYTMTNDNRIVDWCYHQVAKRIGKTVVYTDFEVKTKAYAYKICRELNAYSIEYHYEVIEF